MGLLTILFITALTPTICNDIRVELEHAEDGQVINQQSVDDIYLRCIESCK